jgi:hypothetical protein
MGEKPTFPRNIKNGDELLIRGRVFLTHIHRSEANGGAALEVDFGDGEPVIIPLAAAFGIITKDHPNV